MAFVKLGSVKDVTPVLVTSVDLANDCGSSILPVANGGTGQASYTNGQLLIGNTTGNTLTKATLTGTSDQVIVTNGGGSITLSLPQSIHTTATPTFSGITSTGQMSLTAPSGNWIKLNYTGASGMVTFNSTNADGIRFDRVDVNDDGSNFYYYTNSVGKWSAGVSGDGTDDYHLYNVNAGAHAWHVNQSTNVMTITSLAATNAVLTTPNIGTPSAGVLTNCTGLPLATGVTGTLGVTNGGTGQTTFTNGQLLIGNTTGNTLVKSTLTGTADQVTVTNGSGSITLSTPQDIATTSDVEFGSVTVPAIVAPVDSTTAVQVLKADGTTPVLTIDTTNARIGIGDHASPPAAELHVVRDGGAGTFFFDAYGSSASTITCRRARNTFASPEAMTAGLLGRISFRGYDGSAMTTNRASVDGSATETWSGSANGSKIAFLATPNGSTTAATILTAWGDGQVVVGHTSTPLGKFESRATSGAQIAASYDGTHAATITVDSAASTTIAPSAISGTNQAGGQLNLSSGLGTGNATPARVHIQGPTGFGSTGTTAQTYVDRHITGCTKVLSDGVAVDLVSFTEASNTMIGGVVHYTIECTDGTEFQVITGDLRIVGYNKSGTVNNYVSSFSDHVESAGTLTQTWAISNANPAVLSLNADSSLTPSTGYPRVTYTLENFSQQAVAVQ